MRNVDAAGLGIGDDHPPRIMGVLNVSEESPYDPSVFDDPDEAAAYVDEDLIDEGADVVEAIDRGFDVVNVGTPRRDTSETPGCPDATR